MCLQVYLVKGVCLLYFSLFFFERSRSKQKTTIEEGGGGWKILCLLDHLGRGIWNSQKPATKRIAQRSIEWIFVRKTFFWKWKYFSNKKWRQQPFPIMELLTLRSSPFNNISTHEVVLTDSNYLPYKCHYNPQIVYFLPTFTRPFLCFRGGFFSGKSVLMCGF